MPTGLPNSTLFHYTTLFRSPHLGGFAGALRHQRLEVAVVDFLLLVGQVLELDEDAVEIIPGQLITQFLQPLLQRSEEHTSELQSQSNLVCRLLLEKKNHLLD